MIMKINLDLLKDKQASEYPLPPEQVIYELARHQTVTEVAAFLNVVPAHISNVTTGSRLAGPTLCTALDAVGLLPPKEPYPYLKIRNDDPTIAGQQVINNLGEAYARKMAEYIEAILPFSLG